MTLAQAKAWRAVCLTDLYRAIRVIDDDITKGGNDVEQIKCDIINAMIRTASYYKAKTVIDMFAKYMKVDTQIKWIENNLPNKGGGDDNGKL